MIYVCFRMYIIHITTVYLFYFGILYFIYNNVAIVKVCVDYITDIIKSLIGDLLEKMYL